MGICRRCIYCDMVISNSVNDIKAAAIVDSDTAISKKAFLTLAVYS